MMNNTHRHTQVDDPSISLSLSLSKALGSEPGRPRQTSPLPARKTIPWSLATLHHQVAVKASPNS